MSTSADRCIQADNFVYVPPRKARSEAGSPSSTLSTWMGAEHILFIDDEESLVSVTRSMLEHLGYTVTTFSNPLDCMESFPANMSQFSVIISDHLMPEMNGIDLLVRLREINSSIPVILCTGHADPEIKSQLQEMGCSGLVTKPYTLPQLGETVRRVLDNAAIEL